jgi:uncharacterized protein (DUF2267 family)
MTAFEIVRDSVDIVDAAQRYGIEVSRHNKALCPFHGDSNPSLSFKGQRFKCFSCGAGGDVIDLVGYLANMGPFDTLRELNDTFSLRIDVDKPVPTAEIQRRKQRAEDKKAFAEWEKQAYNILANYFRTLRDWRVEYAPKHTDDEVHPRFLESLRRQDYIEYLLQTVFNEGGLQEKLDFYNNFRPMLEHIARRMRQERDQDAGGTWPGDNPSGIVFPFELAGAQYSGMAA